MNFKNLDQATEAVRSAGSELSFFVWNGFAFEQRAIPNRPGNGGCIIGKSAEVDAAIAARPEVRFGMRVNV